MWYPRPVLGDEPEDGHADLLASLSAMERRDEARGVHTTVVRTWADLDDAPQTVAGAYLRLHVLSHRLVEPNTVNLDGIFSRLSNVVWTSAGPCRAEDFETTRTRLRAALGRPVQVQLPFDHGGVVAALHGPGRILNKLLLHLHTFLVGFDTFVQLVTKKHQ